MGYPQIERHDAKEGVTGSCHQLHMNAISSLLVDCGPLQSSDASIPNEPGRDRLAIEQNTAADPSPIPPGKRAGVRDQANNTETNWTELNHPRLASGLPLHRSLILFWSQEVRDRIPFGRRLLTIEQLITIDSHSDHQRIVQPLAHTARSAIVIAGGGICSGARIVNYLKTTLGEKGTTFFFVGYQFKGTPGHAVQTYGAKGGYVDLDGERSDILAGIPASVATRRMRIRKDY